MGERGTDRINGNTLGNDGITQRHEGMKHGKSENSARGSMDWGACEEEERGTPREDADPTTRSPDLVAPLPPRLGL